MKNISFVKFLFSIFLLTSVFVLPFTTVAQAETVKAPTDTSAAGELAFWNTIKKSEVAGDFEVYLSSFPDGMFVDVAKTRYKELGGETVAETPKVEDAPKVEEAVVVAPEEEVQVKKPKQSAAVVYKNKPQKRVVSVFAKKKKTKAVLAYSKTRTKAKKAAYAGVKPQRKAVKQPKQQRAEKVRYVKPKALVEKKKSYSMNADASGNGSSSSGSASTSSGGGSGGGGTGGGGTDGGGGWNK